MTSKPNQRSAGLQARRTLSSTDRIDASMAIAERVFRSACFHRAKNIGCYLPTPDEVNTWPIIKRAWFMKKRIFVPRIEKNSCMRLVRLKSDSRLVPNAYGIAEPDERDSLSVRRLDVFLMPLAAYDQAANRIGMGGGYFDRAFAYQKHRNLFLRPKLVGLAFACQEVGSIDASPWDIPLFSVITESGRIRNPARSRV